MRVEGLVHLEARDTNPLKTYCGRGWQLRPTVPYTLDPAKREKGACPMNQDKRVLAVGAAGAAGMLCLLLLVLGVFPGISTADKPDNPDKPEAPRAECISTPYFYANDAPAGSNRFGPELADHSLEAGTARFDLKLRSDPAFAAVWEDVILYDMANATPEWYDTRATDFLGNEDLWCEQVGKINAAIDEMTVDDRMEEYETLLMVPRGDAVPAIRKTERPVPMEHVLVFNLKDGRTEFARYVCDLQPARPKIPGIPPVSVPVPPAPSLPPGVTIPPTTPPPTTQPPTTQPPSETTTTTRPSVTTTTTPGPRCPDGSPLPPSGLCPKDPSQSTAGTGQHGGQEEGPSEGPTSEPAVIPPATYVPPTTPTIPPTTRPPVTAPPTTSPPATTPPTTAPPTTVIQPPR